MTLTIAIIGGGAAGMMAAAAAKETAPNAEVTIFERNDALGKKVALTGGGRCNVTTGLTDAREILKRYPRGGRFLNSAMRRFPPTAVRDWFEARGVPLKVEPDQRVFPRSDRGQDVVAAFERLFRETGVRVRLNARVLAVAKDDGHFEVTLADGAERIRADRLIIASGGQSFRQTGSTGDGYAFAEALGHHVTPLAPSLSSLGTLEKWPAEVAGLSFSRVTLTARRDDREFSHAGPFIFTHQGVSGPAVFALSALVAFEAVHAKQPLDLRIDLFPDETTDQLAGRLAAIAAANPAKSPQNILSALVPKSLAEVGAGNFAWPWKRRAAEISRRDWRELVSWLKGLPLHVTARGGGSEFVTAGGVDLKEVDPATMQSKICPGLSLAGEVLDIDAFTGGFNLQSAWATGRTAGQSAAGI